VGFSIVLYRSYWYRCGKMKLAPMQLVSGISAYIPVAEDLKSVRPVARRVWLARRVIGMASNSMDLWYGRSGTRRAMVLHLVLQWEPVCVSVPVNDFQVSGTSFSYLNGLVLSTLAKIMWMCSHALLFIFVGYLGCTWCFSACDRGSPQHFCSVDNFVRQCKHRVVVQSLYSA
jgi:hypothetical protein